MALVFLLAFPDTGHAERVVNVGIYDFKPLVFADDGDDPAGLFVDVLTHVARKEGWLLKYHFGTWKEINQLLLDGELDLIPCIAATETRKRNLDFSSDYLFLDWGVIYADPKSGIDSIFDLKRKRVSVLAGSVYSEELAQLLKQFDIPVTYREEKNYVDVFRAIELQQADAGISTSLTGLRFEREFTAERTPIIFSPVKLTFAVKKGENSELIETLSRETVALKADKASIYYDSYEHWVINLSPHGTPKYVWWGIGTLLMCALMIAIWTISLKRQIKTKTGHLEREIRQRMASEESLLEANNNVENLFSHANAPIIVWDPDLRITRFNRAFETLTGKDSADVIGAHISVLFPPGQMTAAMDVINKTRCGEILETVEIPINGSNGSIRTVLWNSATIYAADHMTPLSTIAQGQDITELRDHIVMEQRLEEQTRIRQLVENEERSCLSRDLHDGAGQSLQAIRLHLQLLANYPKGRDDTQTIARQLITEVAEVASELRDISHQLRPSYLHETTLDAAIIRRCAMLNRRGAPVEVTSIGDFSSLSHVVSDNLYRIMQEALANALRHAAAQRIKVSLTRNADTLTLIISDDGCGIWEFAVDDGMGLRIMKERTELIGAVLNMSSNSTGTTITVSMEVS